MIKNAVGCGATAAARLLKHMGYRIIEKNYRNAIGEIDIIARDGHSLVFVEVKARRSGRFGSAKGAITRKKQQQLSRTALLYLKESGQSEASARFDVVAIDGDGPGQSLRCRPALARARRPGQLDGRQHRRHAGDSGTHAVRVLACRPRPVRTARRPRRRRLE